MSMDLQWLLSADDQATPVFDQLKQNATAATDGVTAALSTVGTGLAAIMSQYGSLIAMAAGGAAFGDFVSSANDWNMSVAALARTMGASLEDASVWSQAMETAGVSQDLAQSASMRLARTLSTNEAAITSLGVATRDGNGNFRSTADIMVAVNQALADNRTGTDRNVAANAIYGRSWSEVQSLLKITPQLLEDSQVKAEELNRIVSQDSVDASRKYKMEMNELHGILDSMKEQIGNALLPVLLEMGKDFEGPGVAAAHALGDGIKWTKDNADVLVVTMGLLAAPSIIEGVTALVGSFEALGGGIAAINAAMLANPAGLAALLAGGFYYAGKQADAALYNVSGVDVSGMNQPVAEMEQAQKSLSDNTTQLNAKLKQLGFSSWTEFDKAEKAGKVVFDQMNSSWKLSTPASTPDNATQLQLMDKQLATYKAEAEGETAVAKEQSALQLAILKGQYDLGLVSTTDYYNAERDAALAAGQKKVDIAIQYQTQEEAVLAFAKQAFGESSKEYLAEYAKHEQAIRSVETAEMAYGQTAVTWNDKVTTAIKARSDAYDKLDITTLDSIGQYVEAETKRQDLDRHAADFLRTKLDAINGVAGAAQALADKEMAAAVANITAHQKEQNAITQQADSYNALQQKIEAYNGVNSNVLSAESAIRDEINKKLQFMNQLELAEQTGVIANYNYAKSMIDLENTRIAQLNQELDLVRREQNLKAQNNAEQIIYNDLVSKGLDIEAFYLKQQMDMQQEQFKAQQDEISFNKQITDALSQQNTELADQLRQAQQIQATLHQTAMNEISDRNMLDSVASAATTVGRAPANSAASPAQNNGYPATTQVSFMGNPTNIGTSGVITSINAPFMGGLDGGTNYVPADGYAYIHKGEAVVPKQYNPGSNGTSSFAAGASMSFAAGSVSINLPNVTNQSTARDLAKQLFPELQKLSKQRVAA